MNRVAGPMVSLKDLVLQLIYLGNTNLGTDVPWFHGIFNVFSLNLVCVKKPFCIDFYVSFSLFVGNMSKDERESF